MSLTRERRLLVEGDDDKRVVPYLLEAHGIVWGESRSEAVVDIEAYGGIERILDEDVIAAELKVNRLKALGILIDANGDPKSRWRQLRNACLPSVPELPETLPEEGLIHVCQSGFAADKRIGVWIFPDNRMEGVLETFLARLVPSRLEALWEWTDDLSDEARTKGAPFKEQHRIKARIHSWLAFQDPPGRQLHNAIMERTLDPESQSAKPFVRWFRELYGV